MNSTGQLTASLAIGLTTGSHVALIIQTSIYFSQIWLTFLSVFILQTRPLFLLLLFVFISLKHILIFFEIHSSESLPALISKKEEQSSVKHLKSDENI